MIIELERNGKKEMYDIEKSIHLSLKEISDTIWAISGERIKIFPRIHPTLKFNYIYPSQPIPQKVFRLAYVGLDGTIRYAKETKKLSTNSPAIIRLGNSYVFMVERGQETNFEDYLRQNLPELFED